MSGPAPSSLHLDIVSDTICPWCYVGKRRLAAALPILKEDGFAFDVTWRPFELNPDMPREGVDRRQYRSDKFGSWEKSQMRDAQVAEAGRSAGLTFRHDLMAKTPNTVASHALVRLAHDAGGAEMQDRVVEALFAAYFTQGLDVGDLTILSDLAEGAGLDRVRASAYLGDPKSLDSVTTEEKLARDLGLNGVPSFVLNGHFLFSGAQSTESMVRALRQASEAILRQPAAPTDSDPG